VATSFIVGHFIAACSRSYSVNGEQLRGFNSERLRRVAAGEAGVGSGGVVAAGLHAAPDEDVGDEFGGFDDEFWLFLIREELRGLEDGVLGGKAG
jgi:hypothetical protein